MPFHKRLLLALAPRRDQSAALERAALIAERLGLTVELLLPAPAVETTHEAELLRQAEAMRTRGLEVEAHQDWQGAFHTTVIEALRRSGAGLLVKAVDPPSALEGLTTPLDWKLMRFAPCPVLLVKTTGAWAGRPVLAAVDANPHDADHAALNRRILAAAARIADSSGGPLHLVSAYSTAMQGSDLSRERAAAKADRYRQACEALCAEQGLNPVAVHLGEGPVESWVSQVARDQDAALVVLGTVARRGLQALLMGGNTAETLLESLEADTLTLKPEGTGELLEVFFNGGGTA